MRFVCEACQAKYQVPDDRVAGKTVRMTCRKCGHLIEVRAGGAVRASEPPAFGADERARISDVHALSVPPSVAPPPRLPPPRPAIPSAPAIAPAVTAPAKGPEAEVVPSPWKPADLPDDATLPDGPPTMDSGASVPSSSRDGERTSLAPPALAAFLVAPSDTPSGASAGQASKPVEAVEAPAIAGDKGPDAAVMALARPSHGHETQARRKSPPWTVVAIVVLSIVFVATAVAVFFPRRPAQAPTASAAKSPPPPPAELPSVPTVSTESTAFEFPAASASASATTSARFTGAGHPAKTGPADPALVGLLRGPTGPASGGASGAGQGPSAGAALTPDELQTVVADRSPALRRVCWERMEGTPTSVKVTARVKVGPAGQVQGASASGNDQAVARCIENSIRAWHFPASGGVTEVNIPFTFLRQ